MKKSKSTINKIGKYFREISVVVIGVAITLSVGIWLNNKSEKKDMAIYLNAIKMELEENLTRLDSIAADLQAAANYEMYLKFHDNKTLNADTLTYYAVNVCYHINLMKLGLNTFEMFKSSGAMRLINDKELLMSIWNVYYKCAALNEILVRYYDRKFEHIEKEGQYLKNGIVNYKGLNYAVTAPMYNFYAVPFTAAILNNKESVTKSIKETLSKLETK